MKIMPFFCLLLMPILSISSNSLVAQEPTPKDSLKTKDRIGIYDSRAIAIAFVGSTIQEREFTKIMTKYKKAQEAKDSETLSKLQAEMNARQATIHKQAFSIAPVDDILTYIVDILPKIQKDAGVSAIVSKWDEPVLLKYSGIERVDVTMRLVDAFQPSERQRKSAVEIQKVQPIAEQGAAANP